MPHRYARLENGKYVDHYPARGRPKKGFVRVDENDNIVKSDSAAVAGQKHGYFQLDGTGLPDQSTFKVCSQGRPPKGYTRLPIDENNHPIIVTTPVIKNVESAQETAESPESPESSEESITIEDFQSKVESAQSMEEEEGRILRMDAVRVIENIDSLSSGDTLSRIDVDLHNGDISVWKVNPKGKPDFIIRGKIQTQNTESLA
tara:strand:- start:1685 stop:2293 length:609 start_codon:yes stop_codon:yes gene_type:complete